MPVLDEVTFGLGAEEAPPTPSSNIEQLMMVVMLMLMVGMMEGV